MVQVEARIVGSSLDEGLGSVLLSPAKQQLLAADLIRLAVGEQIRELTARRRLSAAETVRALRRQYQTSGSISSVPDDPRLDARREGERALAAFTAGTCLLFVNGEQVRDLTQDVAIGIDTKVQFLRLVPLVGG